LEAAYQDWNELGDWNGGAVFVVAIAIACSCYLGTSQYNLHADKGIA
jgi:hypothetical protein